MSYDNNDYHHRHHYKPLIPETSSYTWDKFSYLRQVLILQRTWDKFSYLRRVLIPETSSHTSENLRQVLIPETSFHTWDKFSYLRSSRTWDKFSCLRQVLIPETSSLLWVDASLVVICPVNVLHYCSSSLSVLSDSRKFICVEITVCFTCLIWLQCIVLAPMTQ